MLMDFDMEETSRFIPSPPVFTPESWVLRDEVAASGSY